MWIIPKTLSHFVPDTEGLRLALDEQAWMLEQSVTANGKLMSKQYWLKQLKKVGWMKRLSGLICPPSQHQSFVEKYRDSLADIHANHLVAQGKGKDKKTQDIFGLKLGNTPGQLEFSGFLQKTSKDISRLDSPQSLVIWKKMVTKWRQEYSQRKKLALHTEEKEFLSWATPQASDHVEGARTSLKSNQKCLGRDLKMWPSPRAGNPGSRKPGTGGKVLAEEAKRHAGLLDQEKSNTNGNHREQLSPDWVESLMGLPTGTSDLRSWGMELSPKPQN